MIPLLVYDDKWLLTVMMMWTHFQHYPHPRQTEGCPHSLGQLVVTNLPSRWEINGSKKVISTSYVSSMLHVLFWK